MTGATQFNDADQKPSGALDGGMGKVARCRDDGLRKKSSTPPEYATDLIWVQRAIILRSGPPGPNQETKTARGTLHQVKSWRLRPE